MVVSTLCGSGLCIEEGQDIGLVIYLVSRFPKVCNIMGYRWVQKGGNKAEYMILSVLLMAMFSCKVSTILQRKS